ncbi:MAG TPA: hypothetical protein V6C65_38450 [Allocoleopsis sp.]
MLAHWTGIPCPQATPALNEGKYYKILQSTQECELNAGQYLRKMTEPEQCSRVIWQHHRVAAWRCC